MAEAAEVLGISAEVVRGRIRRGTLPLEREGGMVYVLVDVPLAERRTDAQSRTTVDQRNDRADLLIAELQDRVRSLEEANRENRRIIAALTSRIPAIEAPKEPPESPEVGEGAAEMGQPRPDAPGAQEAPQPRPWWQRVFGG